MIKIYWKKCLVTLLSLVPMICIAAVPSWQIVPKESELTFIAIQNDAPITGKFKTFTGEINVDPTQLSSSNIKVVVDISSMSDVYNQLAETLGTPEWFNIKQFPQAIFQSKEIIKIGDKTYQVKGTLTIRDKTLPITLMITQEEFTPTKGRVKGTTTIQRTLFGVGQGEWADTKTVKDDVKIDFTLTAVKK
jgi:polyisoprenoid-binding protein YceI